MRVDTAKLHSGAAGSFRASEHAESAANHLSGSSPVAGMFGDFGEADAFHEALAAAHTQHLNSLQSQQQHLNDVGAWAHRAGSSFTAMDEHNTSELRKL
ncbi:DUF2563 family protein [Candidatus Mycobacterium wuenschmannii]|uniref:DUF2563 family protein n=1 Tax=Candidatus Mycobacterium wuenschmannii TaxID=3027808 RepID=A0ABY8VWN7_9MYCO|nr:DUF2563 family protein [Candidatus Mycobacterium wuenschmannii]WIM87102.1 DUF2563 family protein [Candidatus Mycobacterium wuenschmannii]